MAEQTKKPQVYWEDTKEGDTLPRISMDITYTKIIQDCATTRDFFPGHHDPEYARKQGQKSIYLNTMFLAGFVDRVITDWAGPGTFIRKRKFSMQKSVFPGDSLFGEGRVSKVYEEEGKNLVDVQVMVSTQDGPCVQATETIILPRRDVH